jgi:glycosyltransferase involved in cell wall biosynthesis
MRRLLVFHRTIAPYRIDFFNDLSRAFETRICLQYRNLLSQKFDYKKIADCFMFVPVYLKKLGQIRGRVFSWGYWSQLDKFRPDIVLVSEFGLDCLLVLLHRFFKKRNYHVVSVCDDSYNMVVENNDFSYTHRLMRRLIAPWLDELILVEPQVTEWYRQNYGKGLFFPIIKKDDTARMDYTRLLSKARETAKMYQLLGRKVVLFVGRLVALKNVSTLIKACAYNHNDASLVIVGDGPERVLLEALAKEEGVTVLFTGRLEGDELLQWYDIASVFCLPSYQEAFGAVTNEALLAGCMGLISSKAGSQCLILEGKNGYTFAPFDTEDLALKLKLSLNRCTPPTFEALRPSQMHILYEDKMKELVRHLYTL